MVIKYSIYTLYGIKYSVYTLYGHKVRIYTLYGIIERTWRVDRIAAFIVIMHFFILKREKREKS